MLESNWALCTDIAAPSDVAVLRSYVNIASTTGLSLGGPLGGLLGGTIGWRW
jgi:predicted MFS family arabinose efflux permease